MKTAVLIFGVILGTVLALNEDQLRDNALFSRSKRALCGEAGKVSTSPAGCASCSCSQSLGSKLNVACTDYNRCCNSKLIRGSTSAVLGAIQSPKNMAKLLLNIFGKRAIDDSNFKKPSADIVFLIDDSGSIASAQFRVAREGAATLSQTLCPQTFGSSRVEKQVSVVLFSSTPQTIMTYEQSQKGAGYVESTILNMKQRSGGTATADALKYVREKVLTQPGNRLNDPDTATVVFVITDGGCNNRCGTLSAEAKKLRETGPGVQVLAFGVGEANCLELETIRGKDAGAVFGLPDYNFFERLANAAKEQMATDSEKICVK